MYILALIECHGWYNENQDGIGIYSIRMAMDEPRENYFGNIASEQPYYHLWKQSMTCGGWFKSSFSSDSIYGDAAA